MSDFAKLTLAERDDAYENGAHIPDAETFFPRWQAEAAAFRGQTTCELDVAYGEGPRDRFDLFQPGGGAKGLFVFVHGGYWKARAKADWSLFAGGMVAAGWAVALVGYPLAPEARISQITQSVSHGIAAAAAKLAGPIRLAGHSAGGHLVARMAMPGVLPGDVAQRVERVMPISPLSDLRPFLMLSMNDILRLTPQEAEAESPILGPKHAHIEMLTVVGGAERPAFQDQNRWLAEAWGIEQLVVPDRHHFDIIDGLVDTGSPMLRWLSAEG